MVDVAFATILLLCAALLWVMWLYVETYRRLVQCQRDNYRLIRRIGQYHGLPLTFPSPDAKPPAASLPPETPVPPAFRKIRPRPL